MDSSYKLSIIILALIHFQHIFNRYSYVLYNSKFFILISSTVIMLSVVFAIYSHLYSLYTHHTHYILTILTSYMLTITHHSNTHHYSLYSPLLTIYSPYYSIFRFLKISKNLISLTFYVHYTH